MGILIISGAGLSAPSGAPTFDGKYPRNISDRSFIEAETKRFEKLKPNQAHYELARLQQKAMTADIHLRHITLNVDALNELSGGIVEHVYGLAKGQDIVEIAKVDFFDLSWITEHLIILIGLSGLGIPLSWVETYCRDKQKKVISFNLVLNPDLECYQCLGDVQSALNAESVLSYYQSLTK